MPLQNRVLPDGRIVAIPARGSLMGNRGGRIHDPGSQSLTKRRWASKAWICCLTEFKGWHRPVMGHSYTELFFLDEVTALSAGHRPCFECRRADAVQFARAFATAKDWPQRARAGAMDDRLHQERLTARPTFDLETVPSALPEGTMLRVGSDEAGSQEHFLAVLAGGLVAWTPEGYRPWAPSPKLHEAEVLTPSSIVATLGAGYRPKWHPTAAHFN